ncbi:hypothetical protein ACGF0J_18680 [Nonomuraea sp. NPDC047897]|uniref:hypothetical protein n=1 Tax=Nonomuraea sp. NPDC047897 TaxID=3364346 RepID=UPI003721099F
MDLVAIFELEDATDEGLAAAAAQLVHRGAAVAVALIEEFGIANATGQKVMRALRADGLIRTEPGMGSFVTTPEERQAAGD